MARRACLRVKTVHAACRTAPYCSSHCHTRTAAPPLPIALPLRTACLTRHILRQATGNFVGVLAIMDITSHGFTPPSKEAATGRCLMSGRRLSTSEKVDSRYKMLTDTTTAFGGSSTRPNSSQMPSTCSSMPSSAGLAILGVNLPRRARCMHQWGATV